MPFTQMAALSFWVARKLKKTSRSILVVKRSQNSHRLSEIPISNFMRSTSEMLIRKTQATRNFSIILRSPT